MNNLLHANFARLWKNKLFGSGTVFMFGFGLFEIISNYNTSIKMGEQLYLSDVLFAYAFIAGIISAIFICFFTGTDYSDGTIRNKLIIGHSRSSVYFTNLITNVLAVTFMCFAYVIAVLLIGTVIIGSLDMETGQALKIFFSSFLLITAYCSIYTGLSMLCHNKATAVAIGTVASFLFLFSEAYIGSMLNFPGYWTGTKRIVLECIFNYLPSGQSYQYMSLQFDHSGLKMLCLAVISILSAFVGVMFFQKKDIR